MWIIAYYFSVPVNHISSEVSKTEKYVTLFHLVTQTCMYYFLPRLRSLKYHFHENTTLAHAREAKCIYILFFLGEIPAQAGWQPRKAIVANNDK